MGTGVSDCPGLPGTLGVQCEPQKVPGPLDDVVTPGSTQEPKTQQRQPWAGILICHRGCSHDPGSCAEARREGPTHVTCGGKLGPLLHPLRVFCHYYPHFTDEKGDARGG